jgi:hypothetical protein
VRHVPLAESRDGVEQWNGNGCNGLPDLHICYQLPSGSLFVFCNFLHEQACVWQSAEAPRDLLGLQYLRTLTLSPIMTLFGKLVMIATDKTLFDDALSVDTYGTPQQPVKDPALDVVKRVKRLKLCDSFSAKKQEAQLLKLNSPNEYSP